MPAAPLSLGLPEKRNRIEVTFFTSRHKKLGNMAIRAIEDGQATVDVARWFGVDLDNLSQYIVFAELSTRMTIERKGERILVYFPERGGGFYFTDNTSESFIRDIISNEIMSLMNDESDVEQAILDWCRKEERGTRKRVRE